eukprot:scaffold210535_cov19-Tisochrysis_lutea.AAC.1
MAPMDRFTRLEPSNELAVAIHLLGATPGSQVCKVATHQVACEKAEGMPKRGQAPGPAHTVDVGLQTRGEVVVDDVRELADVKAASSHVCGHHDLRSVAIHEA